VGKTLAAYASKTERLADAISHAQAVVAYDWFLGFIQEEGVPRIQQLLEKRKTELRLAYQALDLSLAAVRTFVAHVPVIGPIGVRRSPTL
jgi:precorrin-3B methylase